MQDTSYVCGKKGMGRTLQGICCAILIGEHLNNIKNNIPDCRQPSSRSFHQYYVKFKTSMLKKTHQSLHKLQSTLCNELKHLQLYHSSHKKAHSSSCLKTPNKSTTSMRLSESKCVKNAKQQLVQFRSITQKPKGEGKKGFYGDCLQGMKQSKQQKLKKKGANHFKSKANLWEMSEVSTKCNDSKVQQGCPDMSELMKKNKYYQQIINHQRNLIQKLERIINQSYDLSNL